MVVCTIFVYTLSREGGSTMLKNVTLSAEDSLLRRARKRAQRENTTLNALFRRWLSWYVSREKVGTQYDELMLRLGYARPGRSFTRDEMNER
jgi:hypothetical protein